MSDESRAGHVRACRRAYPSFDRLVHADEAVRAAALTRMDSYTRHGVLRTAKERLGLLAPVGPGTRLCEIGPGTGRDAAAAAHAGAQVTLVDIDPELLGPHPGIVASVESIGLRDGSFDVVRADRVLQHIGCLSAGVAEMVRICARGAKLATITPDWTSLTSNAPNEAFAQFASARCIPGAFTATPDAGRVLPEMLCAAGAVVETLETFELVSTSPTGEGDYLRIREAVEACAASGLIDSCCAEALRAWIREGRRGGWRAGLRFSLIVAHKP